MRPKHLWTFLPGLTNTIFIGQREETLPRILTVRVLRNCPRGVIHTENIIVVNTSLTLAILRYQGAPLVEPTTTAGNGTKLDDSLMHVSTFRTHQHNFNSIVCEIQPIASEGPGKVRHEPRKTIALSHFAARKWTPGHCNNLEHCSGSVYLNLISSSLTIGP